MVVADAVVCPLAIPPSEILVADLVAEPEELFSVRQGRQMRHHEGTGEQHGERKPELCMESKLLHLQREFTTASPFSLIRQLMHCVLVTMITTLEPT
jgi:hypothetical protein